ncbi:uncharacterized protein LOC123011420 [Tribolium madens]|uniref:uncharacterized protein LOC123011420 n=1 Tax=Tribolium madens TaxID=41895 RepID=UPI001CF75C4E|nr:uncharacterized protein LOC123011420 [Tribolium madens]XP_044264776.1 uncharacterized protein LOC123011420 [Tribolium madens]
MLNVIRQYVPHNWDQTLANSIDLNQCSEEYKNVLNDVNEALQTVSIGNNRIQRVQDIYAFGQFLIREQQLLKTESTTLYRVRRFVQVSSLYAQKVAEYNLDQRRCGLGQSLTLHKKLNYYDSSNIIVVVKALVTDPLSSETSVKRSSDYYVEYIVHP